MALGVSCGVPIYFDSIWAAFVCHFILGDSSIRVFTES